MLLRIAVHISSMIVAGGESVEPFGYHEESINATIKDLGVSLNEILDVFGYSEENLGATLSDLQITFTHTDNL